MRGERVIACRSRKLGWSKRQGAKRHADKMKRYDGRERRVYECPWCGHWHTTSKPPRG